jgi:hypothetical protein
MCPSHAFKLSCRDHDRSINLNSRLRLALAGVTDLPACLLKPPTDCHCLTRLPVTVTRTVTDRKLEPLARGACKTRKLGLCRLLAPSLRRPCAQQTTVHVKASMPGILVNTLALSVLLIVN